VMRFLDGEIIDFSATGHIQPARDVQGIKFLFLRIVGTKGKYGLRKIVFLHYKNWIHRS
jgi:hypothetical protein